MGAGSPALAVFLVGAVLFGFGAYGVTNAEVESVAAAERFFTTYSATFATDEGSGDAVPSTTTAYGGNAMEMFNYTSANMTSLTFTFSCTDSTTGSANFPANIRVELKGPTNETMSEELSGCATREFVIPGAAVPESREVRAAHLDGAREKLAAESVSLIGAGEYHFTVQAAGTNPVIAAGQIAWKVVFKDVTYRVDDLSKQIESPR